MALSEPMLHAAVQAVAIRQNMRGRRLRTWVVAKTEKASIVAAIIAAAAVASIVVVIVVVDDDRAGGSIVIVVVVVVVDCQHRKEHILVPFFASIRSSHKQQQQ